MSRPNAQWPNYDPQTIEPKWQKLWEQSGLYLAREGADKPKFYCLDYFPYPSGEGLHVGHCRNYMPTDVLSCFKRMQGYNVLHPMGWDAFGEPTEQYAISHGINPRQSTDQNTANFRRQLTIIGNGYDWSREIDSSRPEYYRWTQLFFIMMYQRGLAYRDTNWQWWCPTCQTTLSSHEVVDGVCWRGHEGVTRKEIPAWYFKITAYADELLDGLDDIDWPEPIKAMQRNWIGRSEGMLVNFRTSDDGHPGEGGQEIQVFTTRPDTLYGVTFFVLAPEHPFVKDLTTPEQRLEVESYVEQSIRRSEVDRMAETREKTGVFTGGTVINPVNGERLPVWIADYVLLSYGTGAVMGVPAHDQRDFEFARKYGLPIRVVVSPEDAGEDVDASGWSQAYTGDGCMVNSGPFDSLSSQEGRGRISDYLEEHATGKRTAQFRMHDWLISRQRYWGTPIPIIYCQDCGVVTVPEDQLPVRLPEMQDIRPDGSGRSPLARDPEFVNTTCPSCGGPAQRETDTMGGFACSSWYFLRFTSPHNDQAPFDPQAVSYWMPVDLYVGGAEHAVLHLLYARFWTRFLADAGLLSFREPFARLLNQGQLMGPDGRRMSKSRGNVIPPDAVVESHGADALRVYTLFLAPFEQDADWSTEGINGARRFLNRVWNLFAEAYSTDLRPEEDDPDLERKLHQAVHHVTERLETIRFNTMVSALMEFVRILSERQQNGTWRTKTYYQSLEILLRLLAPVAPHIADELWSLTGHRGSVHEQAWPAWDPDLAREETVQVAVQVNGRLREVIETPAGSSQEEVEQAALSLARVQQHLKGLEIAQTFYVPGRILNIVTKPAPKPVVEP